MSDQMIPHGPAGPIRDASGLRAVRPYAQAQLPQHSAAQVGPGSAAYVPRLPAAPSPHAVPGTPVVDVAHDPVDRLLHAYLGRGVRFAVARAMSAWIDLDDDARRLLPLDYVQAQDQALATLRVGVVDEPVAVTAADAAYLWAAVCLECGAEVERACMGVPSGLHVHTARLFAVLLAALSDGPEVAEMVDRAAKRWTAQEVAARAGSAVPEEDQAAVRALAELHLAGRAAEGQAAAGAVAEGGDR